MKKEKKIQKPAESIEKIDFQKRSDGFISDMQLLKIKHGLDFQISMDFPEYKELPDDLKLALTVMNKHKYRYVLGFQNTEQK
jgi:hypothetical protein